MSAFFVEFSKTWKSEKKFLKPLVFYENMSYNIYRASYSYVFKEVQYMNNEQTMTFNVIEDRETEMKKTLTVVYDALREKGYNPINQIVGYILSEDPTYITTYNNARSLILHIDRDELLQTLVKSYLCE